MSRFYRSSGDHLLDFFRGLRSGSQTQPWIFAWKFGEVLERNNRYPNTLATVFYLAARATTDSAFACFANEGARQAGKEALVEKLDKWCAVASGKMGVFDQRSLSNLMGAFHALRVRPPRDFLESWTSRVPSQLRPEHHITLQEITTALAGLAIYPEEKVSKVLVTGTENLAVQLSLRGISAHLYRLAVLNSLCPEGQQDPLKQSAQDIAEYAAARLLHTNGKGISPPERRQLLAVLHWFSEKEITGIEAPFENGVVSSSEISLQKSFQAAGASLQEPFICAQTGHKFDLSMRFQGCARPTFLEYDGPCHFVGEVRGDGIFYDGNTIFQTRLHHKILPEEVIVRVPYFVHGNQKENRQMWYRASEAIAQASPGIYMLEKTGALTPFCQVIGKPLNYSPS
jgi:hypothetical protein